MPKLIPHKIIDGGELKYCGFCKQYLPLHDYTKNQNCADGLNAWCRCCISKYYKETREKRRECERSWVERNKDKVREYKKRYRDNHPETMKAIYNRRAQKIKETVDGRLNNIVRVCMGYSLHRQKNGLHWESLVAYTLDELKNHLESKFKEGMTWENHSRYGWHIDHIKPIRSFHFTSPDSQEFAECWALENLQPLWWDENLKKSCKTNIV